MRISGWSSDWCSSDLGKFSYPPQLLLVDGGKGQLSVATRVLEELGLAEEIPVASLAKQFEEVYVPGLADPIRIPRQSEALYLLQRVRDEAHRFAITYHRQLRAKRRSEEHTSELQSLMRISYAVFCLKKKTQKHRK